MYTNITSKMARHIIYLGVCCYLLPLTVSSQQIGCTNKSVKICSWGKEVIEHYLHTNDQEKIKAAYFLVTSMSGHRSPMGYALHAYKSKANHCKIPCSQDTLSRYWIEINKHNNGRIKYIEDTVSLNKDFLISHIEHSFQAWKDSPWHKDICFEDFCNYILPYRISEEMISYEGREVLKSKYASLILGETDIVKAFTIICTTMFKHIRQTNPQCPFTLDAHTIDYLQQGNCLQRCVLLTEVLRSLGIPCTIDVVPVWANYSQAGHSWVVMPYKGLNYTWRERDTIARADNPVDASYFQVTYRPTENDKYPYPIESRKKASKIYRMRYKNDCQIHSINIPKLFTENIDDVSAIYGLTDSVTLVLPSIKNEFYYLCTFQTGKGWTPIACALSHQGSVTFYNVGKDIVYLAASYEQGIIHPVSYPFLLDESENLRYFHADNDNKIKCKLCRKYPIFSQWTNQWGNMIGGTFEGSNNHDFSEIDTLATINSMPFGETLIPVSTDKSYRYIRYQSTNKSRTPLAELILRNKDNRILKGNPICHKSLQKSKERVFDGDITTEGYTKQTNYWVGLDLGDSIQTSVSQITFFPKNDGNFVTRGHFYELFYYDNGWHSLGERFAVDDYVEYDIPEGALLWLKCDIGNEERIFEYKEGQQVWY